MFVLLVLIVWYLVYISSDKQTKMIDFLQHHLGKVLYQLKLIWQEINKPNPTDQIDPTCAYNVESMETLFTLISSIVVSYCKLWWGRYLLFFVHFFPSFFKTHFLKIIAPL